MNAFSLDECEPVESKYRRGRGPGVGTLWLTLFTSVLAAVLVGGVLLGIGLRFYVQWSIKDTVEKIQEKQKVDFGKTR